MAGERYLSAMFPLNPVISNVSVAESGSGWVHYNRSSVETEELTVAVGGEVCHLCGQNKKIRNTYQKRRKDGTWKTRYHHVYDCGTFVEIVEGGKKRVIVGPKCIELHG